MSSRNRRGNRTTVTKLRGSYNVVGVGNSKGIACFNQLESFAIPTALGEQYHVFFREEGPDGDPEVVLKPKNHE